ncbi:Na+/H+ antiporter NhaA [Vibrio sp. WXL210]|uniref:Na+/H+ antiporter NhaA n=1 Tax=Vibrio sp. WXL210 TaxID=3450709 RepID=UPI003EC52186
MIKVLRTIVKSEASGGILLLFATLCAMILANSPLSGVYHAFLHTYVLGMSVSHWINDGLMAIFFLLIGLEVKRELLHGALKTKQTALFPAIAALGGMIVPALIYVMLNWQNPEALSGWAIPAATDIAFALGVMALLGDRVPTSLKVFLLALAIIDDLGAIVIIALFYTSDLSTLALLASVAATVVLFVMNVKKVYSIPAYLFVGLILWAAVLASGIHATIAGVLLGFAIPLEVDKKGRAPLEVIEDALSPYVVFIILPVFAFTNAGITLKEVSIAGLTSMVPVGIAMGLMVGKPIGITAFCWLAIKLKLAKLPRGTNFGQVVAVSVLCGIGFTMSIFITSLAFTGDTAVYENYARLGVLMGSSLSAIAGFTILWWSLRPRTRAVVQDKRVSEQ